MALKTVEEYKASLQKLRPNIHKFGELITDVTTHPATKWTVEGHSQIYAAAQDPKLRDVVTTKSHLTGEPISRYLSIITSMEDQVANSKMKREIFHLTGTCTGGRCAGFTAINAMWSVTYEIDQAKGTDYHERLKAWLIDAQARDICVAGALTDAKGDRTKGPTEQADPDMFLHIKEVRDDGIVVRGAKVMICGIAAANEIFVLPGSAYREGEADYAISFALPKDTDGLIIVETRHPNDSREMEDCCSFDTPVKQGGITQAYLFFEDVFVPKDRVFMCREHEFTLNAITYFTLPYRSAIGGCVAGQGDVMTGAAMLVARANGLADKVFRDKIVEMAINNETTFSVGLAAAVMGKKHPSGAWICDPLIANVNKVHVARLPYQTKVLAQDISGGIAETGCMPSYIDFMDKELGPLIQKYMKAATDAETRARAARLVEWLTIGGGVPGCMHGGGSPDGAKLMINRAYPLQSYVEMARRLAGIEKELPDPGKVKK